MKTITTFIIAAATTFSLTAANAASVHGDPGIGDVFPMQDIVLKQQVINTVKDTGDLVWSVEYEEWVNPADFNPVSKATVASALRDLENNPPAAGQRSTEVFKWDEMAGEYQLQ
jgi:hypothetical protein